MNSFKDLLQKIRIVPVLTVTTIEEAVLTCKALQSGGINAAEITLRTAAGFASIEAVKSELSDFIVGAGTVKTPYDMEQVAKLGVDFAVSPGLTDELGECADALNLAFLPGVATASELMRGLVAGRHCFKLFPAEAVGGTTLLKSLAAPFPEASFCPTGGISSDNYKSYLALPNVICVGGSWMVSRELIEGKQWHKISRLSEQAMSIS